MKKFNSFSYFYILSCKSNLSPCYHRVKAGFPFFDGESRLSIIISKMRKELKIVYSLKKMLLGSALCVLFLLCQTADAEIMVNATCGDLPHNPWLIGNGDTFQKLPGIEIEIMQQAAKEAGIVLNLQRAPSKRIISDLELGTLDAGLCYSYKEDRTKFADYPMKNGKPDASRRLHRIAYAVYKLKKSPVDWNGTQFINLKGAVGSLLGWSIAGDVAKLGVKVEEIKSVERNLEKLKSNHIDAIVLPEETADFVIAKGKYKDIVKLPKLFDEKIQYILFSKNFTGKNPGVAIKFWDKIGILRDKMTKTLLPKYENYLEEN